MHRRLNILLAFAYGIRDGWRQPYDVSWTQNVEHLISSTGEDDALEWEDRGINVGQFLRAGRKSESWQGRYWPFGEA